MTYNCTCKECSAAFTGKRSTAEFCSIKCRKDWNNRRAMRGAQLYDAFMAMRYDREAAKASGIDWTFICRMGEMFHAEDKRSPIAKSHRAAHSIKQDLGARVNARVGRI